ncbi:MAG: hypothetical protein FWD16_00455, partial [Clostridia bacterium]|nr:hypothetical protein [Clostridia bacterium]
FLPIGNLSLPIGEYGDWAVVSNMGIVDGQLHIQMEFNGLHQNDNPFGALDVLDDNDDIIARGRTYVYDPSYTTGNNALKNYMEVVYNDLDINNIDLSNLRLSPLEGRKFETEIKGPWQLSFTVEKEMPTKHLVADVTGSDMFTSLEFTVSPMHTLIHMKYKENTVKWYYDINDPPEDFEKYLPKNQFGSSYSTSLEKYISESYLVLKDGTQIQMGRDIGSTLLGENEAISTNPTPYVDIEQLRLIVFCGVEYQFD